MDNQAVVGLEGELEMHRSKWKELEEKGEKFLLEVKKGILDLELLKSKFSSLEREKIGIENEVKVLKRGIGELEKEVNDFGKQKGVKSVLDLTDDEEDRIAQLMIENNVLECEKKAAESAAEDLKLKCKRLETEILALREGNVLFNEKFTSDLDEKTNVLHSENHMEHLKGIGDSPETENPSRNRASEERKRGLVGHSRVRKILKFGDEVSTFTKMAPSTPGIGRVNRSQVVVLSDSEDDQDCEDNQDHKTYVRKPDLVSLKNYIGNEDGISNSPCASTPKRKRVVHSDSESEEDGLNIPIHKIMSKQIEREQEDELNDFDITEGVKEKPSPRRRLVRKYDKKIPESTNTSYEILKDEELEDVEDVEDDEDDTGSSTRSGSLDGFIVSGSDISENDANSSSPEEVSDDREDNQDHEDGIRNSSCASNHKRRRVQTISVSDCEGGEEDDHITIGELMRKQVKREPKDELSDFDAIEGVKGKPLPRRRLVRKYDNKVPERTNCSYEILKDEESEDPEDDTGSSTGNGSSDGFIVSGSDISEGDANSSVPEEVSDDDVDYKDVISKIRRKQERKGNWEFEADMLADFAKSTELCMKAVCALYRQQTQEEQCCKGTFVLNGRGFSQCDATRGSILAEFLCDGGNGDVCKTVKELEDYSSEGPELCKTLAFSWYPRIFSDKYTKESAKIWREQTSVFFSSSQNPIKFVYKLYYRNPISSRRLLLHFSNIFFSRKKYQRCGTMN